MALHALNLRKKKKPLKGRTIGKEEHPRAIPAARKNRDQLLLGKNT